MDIFLSFLKAFAVGGAICAVGQIIMDMTKLTPGRILVCFVVAGVVLGAVLVRLVFIPLGLDDMLPVRLPVYVAIAAAIGFLVSLLGFGR